MIPSPLYKDPIYNGAADPMFIRKESEDGSHWHYRGVAADDCAQEGPNVFQFGGCFTQAASPLGCLNNLS